MLSFTAITEYSLLHTICAYTARNKVLSDIVVHITFITHADFIIYIYIYIFTEPFSSVV